MLALAIAAAAAMAIGPQFFGWISDKLLAPAVVAVMFTGLTNHILERRKATRDLVTKMADTLRDDLRNLQQSAVDYWGRDYKKGDVLVEARITAVQSDVLRSLAALHDFGVVVCTPESDLTPEFLDSLTGGEFGSLSRKADPTRLLRLTQVIGDLRDRVLRRRAERLSRKGA